VGGGRDSAGGNLRRLVAIACRDAGVELAAQLLVYPVTDVAGSFADTKENARFPSRAEKRRRLFPVASGGCSGSPGHYLGDARPRLDWRVSPLRAKTLAGLAPCNRLHGVVRSVARRGAMAYADALQAAEVATKYYQGAGLIHGLFWPGRSVGTARIEAQRARADFRALLERGVQTRSCGFRRSLGLLLRRGRLIRWFAENAATPFAQTGPLLAHAGP